MILERPDFELLRQDPKIESVFVAALAAEIRRLAAALTDALYLTANDHLWKRLADLERVFSTGTDPIELKITQANLATLAGLTRQTASKFLDDAETAGIVRRDRRGHIVVLDATALRKHASRL